MNPIMKRITVFTLVLAMMFTFAACGGSDDNTVLAKIGDTEITQGQVDGYTSYNVLMTYQMSKADFESQYGEDYVKYLQGLLLDYAVEVELLKQHYEEEGVKVIPDDFDDSFKSYKETLLSQGDNIQAQLDDAGVDDATLEFFYRAQYYASKFMEDIEKEDPTTDDDIEKYYNENKDSLVSPAQIKVSHILIKDEEHSEAGKTSIEAIKAKIDEGESFEDMAKEYSEDGSASDGGNLGWVDEDVNYVQEFKDAAFALKKGEMSDIVNTEYGYHLIKVTDQQEEHQKTLKEASDGIKDELQSKKYSDGIESLKNEFNVEYTDAGNELKESNTATTQGDTEE